MMTNIQERLPLDRTEKLKNLTARFNAGVDFDDLYERELEVEQAVLKALEGRRGQRRRLTRSELTKQVNIELGYIWLPLHEQWLSKDGLFEGISSRKVRNAVRELRRAGALIISTGGTRGGYWMAQDLEEVKEFTEKEYHARAMDMLVTESKMKIAARRQFGGQKELEEND